MPNPGGIHLGCERCRQRRIKCDRSSPSCRRCRIYGMPCPGYPQTRDVIFRDETLKTAHRVSAGIYTEATGAPGRSTDIDTLNAATQRVLSNPVHRPLKLPDSLTSICFFIHQVVIPVGWYLLIPKLYERSGPGGCFKWAIEAASMFLFANRTGKDQLLVQARTLYISALNATNIAISDPVERLKDETFCAILILNIIDDITGDLSFIAGTHLDGCRELLIQREVNGHTSSSASDLALSVVIQTQPRILGTQKSIPNRSLQWLSKQHPGTLAGMILVECINIHQLRLNSFSMLSRSSESVSEHTSQLKGVFDALEMIDSRLVQMGSQFGGIWGVHTIPQPAQAGTFVAVDYYHNIQVSKLWNQRRSARIALHEVLFAICNELQARHRVPQYNDWEILQRRSVKIIASMSSEICASIPFHLRKLNESGQQSSSDAQQVAGACALIWPLGTVAKSRYSSEEHRLLARTTLAEIGNAIGVRQAIRTLSEISEQDSISLSS